MSYRVIFSGCSGHIKDASSPPVSAGGVVLILLLLSLLRTPLLIKAERTDCDASPAPERLKSDWSLLIWTMSITGEKNSGIYKEGIAGRSNSQDSRLLRTHLLPCPHVLAHELLPGVVSLLPSQVKEPWALPQNGSSRVMCYGPLPVLTGGSSGLCPKWKCVPKPLCALACIPKERLIFLRTSLGVVPEVLSLLSTDQTRMKWTCKPRSNQESSVPRTDNHMNASQVYS